MATAGYTSTYAEVATLVAAFGEAKVVAIVLQIAYSNFLYRMTLALGLPGRGRRPASTAGSPVCEASTGNGDRHRHGPRVPAGS